MSDRRRGLWAVAAFVVSCKLAAATGPWAGAGAESGATLGWVLALFVAAWAWLYAPWVMAAAVRRMARRSLETPSGTDRHGR